MIPMCFMISSINILCGLLFEDYGLGSGLKEWFSPDKELSFWLLEDWSFFERFPFAQQEYYGDWCWAIFVPQAIWAVITAFLVNRSKVIPGGKTVHFVILYSCGSIVLESMLRRNFFTLPLLSFVKANQIFCAIALLTVILICIFRLPQGKRLKPAVIMFVQFIASIGIIIALEFTAFEKKIPFLAGLRADGSHLVMAAACVWIALAIRPVWKRAFSVVSGQ